MPESPKRSTIGRRIPFRYARSDRCEENRGKENTTKEIGAIGGMHNGIRGNKLRSLCGFTDFPIFFGAKERESGAEYARSLISIQSHARILRSYRVARSRELHSNFSTFDRKNVCDANVHFPRSVLVTVFKDIKVNSTMMFLQKRNLNCKLLFQENICNLNAMLLRICQRRNLIYFPSIL